MKGKLAACALCAAIVLAFTNMLMPPQGEIDASVINVFAQLLIFAATLLGVDAVVINRMKPPLTPPFGGGQEATANT